MAGRSRDCVDVRVVVIDCGEGVQDFVLVHHYHHHHHRNSGEKGIGAGTLIAVVARLGASHGKRISRILLNGCATSAYNSRAPTPPLRNGQHPYERVESGRQESGGGDG